MSTLTYFVYILRCRDGSLYTGIATDVQRRVQQHNRGQGAKYVASRRPAQLVYHEGPFQTRGLAQRRECEVKRLGRSQKLELIDNSYVA